VFAAAVVDRNAQQTQAQKRTVGNNRNHAPPVVVSADVRFPIIGGLVTRPLFNANNALRENTRARQSRCKVHGLHHRDVELPMSLTEADSFSISAISARLSPQR
jgi:hypothetical protein